MNTAKKTDRNFVRYFSVFRLFGIPTINKIPYYQKR